MGCNKILWSFAWTMLFAYVSPREKLLLRRFAAGMTDSEIAGEFRDRPSRIAAQRQRLAEKFDIRTTEQFATVADEPARHPSWNAFKETRSRRRVRC
jgi:DNA-binding CsgD family transcriptional regulator